jgi:SAM-dependent methyltransferase
MVRVLAFMLLIFSLALGASFAQQTAGPHPQDNRAGNHQMSGPSAGTHHSFENAEQWAKQFDNPNRDSWQKPDEVFDALQLAPTAIIADLGAGTGYFSVRIAERVPRGKVYAVDIEPDMLCYLDERKHHEHLSVLQPVQASADAAHLPEPVDRLAIIDFKVDAPDGPPSVRSQRFSQLGEVCRAIVDVVIGVYNKNEVAGVPHAAREGDRRTRSGRL